MPVLPPQSPARVGVDPAAAPASVMSRKSQSEAVTAAAVMVLVVPMVSERINTRCVALEPEVERVPFTVQFASNDSVRTPELVRAVMSMLFAVNAAFADTVTFNPLVNATL